MANISTAKVLLSRNTRVNLSNSQIKHGLKCVYEDLFGGCISYHQPTADEVMSQVNFKASSGLLNVWHSKRHYRLTMYEIIYGILNGSFDLLGYVRANEDVVPFTAAFIRNQITDSGLKARLVFAVGYVFVVVETYFNLKIKFVFDYVRGNAIHGYTQLEISKLMLRCSNRNTICIDYKNFDQLVPLVVLVSVFFLTSRVLTLSTYELNLFIISFSFFLVMPVFHPEFEFTEKFNGIVSGSGYTSRIGSLANYFMLSIAMKMYCNENGIVYDRTKFTILVSSDDTVIDSEFVVDFDKFKAIMFRTFKMEIELEYKSGPGECKAFFLGSEWIWGIPKRNVNRMFARMVFGTGNYPKMTDLEYFQSRAYEIFGNTSEFSSIYRTFNLPFPDRVFRSLELSDFVFREEIKLLMATGKSKDNRGVWIDTPVSLETCDKVWTSR